MRDNERDALVALVNALDSTHISSWQSTAGWQKELDAAREALAAPAEGGQGEAEPMTRSQVLQWIGACNNEPAREVLRAYLRLKKSIPPAASADVAKLQRYRMASAPDGTRNLHKDDSGTWVRLRDVERLIDSAGGAKGERDAYEGAREDLLDWKGRAQRAEQTLRGLGYTGIDASEAPQPGEGEGAVAWNDEAAWALAKQAEAAGAERDSDDNETWWVLRIEHFNALTRPAATAQVPPAKPLPDLMMDTYHEAIGWNACRAAMLAAAPAAPKGGVADEATTAGMADEYRRWIDFYHAGEGDFADFMRREYPDQSEFATTPTEQGATGEQP